MATVLALGLIAALLFPLRASAEPASSPAPTVASTTAKLDKLARQTERLAEAYNLARLDVTTAQRAVTTAQHNAAAAATKYRVAFSEFAEMVTDDYVGGATASTGALLSSASPSDYLDRLDVSALVGKEQAQVVHRLEHAKSAATAARKSASASLQVAETKKRAVSQQRDRTAAETKTFTALLATLTARQRAAYAARDAATPAQQKTVLADAKSAGKATSGTSKSGSGKLKSVHAGSAAAQRAVDFALAQIGKPYAYGADGPGSYDCSGLTMKAWKAGGVSLPHNAAAQYNYGTHVSASDLEPGDLVFFYQPIGHVSMYVGNGMLVSAPQTGENVKLVSFANARKYSEFVGATRLA